MTNALRCGRTTFRPEHHETAFQVGVPLCLLIPPGGAGRAPPFFCLTPVAKEVLQSVVGGAATGMEVKIAKVDIGLLTPVISVEGVKLYNRPEFGGSPCLDLPELYVEYDKAALAARKLRLKLLRLSVAEMDLTRDNQGRFESSWNGGKKQSSRRNAAKPRARVLNSWGWTSPQPEFPAAARVGGPGFVRAGGDLQFQLDKSGFHQHQFPG